MDRSGMATRALLEDTAFRAMLLEELGRNRTDPVASTVLLAETHLVRRGVPRDRAQHVAVAYVIGILVGSRIYDIAGRAAEHRSTDAGR